MDRFQDQREASNAQPPAPGGSDSMFSPLVVGSKNILISSDAVECRVIIAAIVTALNAGPESRGRGLAIIKLEEAAMWLYGA